METLDDDGGGGSWTPVSAHNGGSGAWRVLLAYYSLALSPVETHLELMVVSGSAVVVVGILVPVAVVALVPWAILVVVLHCHWVLHSLQLPPLLLPLVHQDCV